MKTGHYPHVTGSMAMGKAPEVTQRRLYLETMESILPDVEKVIIEPGTAQAVGQPVRIVVEAEPPIERARRVPVEHGEFEPGAAARHGEAGETGHERAPEPQAPDPLAHVEVLEIEAAPALEGRVAVEEQGEADRHVALFGQQAFEARPLPESVAQDVGLGGADLIEQILVGRELANQAQDRRRVLAPGHADIKLLDCSIGHGCQTNGDSPVRGTASVANSCRLC